MFRVIHCGGAEGLTSSNQHGSSNQSPSTFCQMTLGSISAILMHWYTKLYYKLGRRRYVPSVHDHHHSQKDEEQTWPNRVYTTSHWRNTTTRSRQSKRCQGWAQENSSAWNSTKKENWFLVSQRFIRLVRKNHVKKEAEERWRPVKQSSGESEEGQSNTKRRGEEKQSREHRQCLQSTDRPEMTRGAHCHNTQPGKSLTNSLKSTLQIYTLSVNTSNQAQVHEYRLMEQNEPLMMGHEWWPVWATAKQIPSLTLNTTATCRWAAWQYMMRRAPQGDILDAKHLKTLCALGITA